MALLNADLLIIDISVLPDQRPSYALSDLDS